MNCLRTTPTGRDVIIHKAQLRLYEKLTAKWGVALDGYPRCYVIQQERNGRPERTIEHYQGNNQYSGNLICAEGNKFFFVCESPEEAADAKVSNVRFETEIDLYFIVNAGQIKGFDQRGDAGLHSDVVFEIRKCPGLNVVSVISDNNSFFRGFIMPDNMHPYHFFKVQLKTGLYKIGAGLCRP